MDAGAGDLYAALGVPRSATAADIKKAFRKLALRLHPDKNPGDARAEEAFKRVSEAWNTLGSPDKRAAYDRDLAFGGGGGWRRGGRGGWGRAWL